MIVDRILDVGRTVVEPRDSNESMLTAEPPDVVETLKVFEAHDAGNTEAGFDIRSREITEFGSTELGSIGDAMLFAISYPQQENLLKPNNRTSRQGPREK